VSDELAVALFMGDFASIVRRRLDGKLDHGAFVELGV
jgi:hypothetical protein